MQSNIKPLQYPFTSAAGQHITSVTITRLKRRDLTAAHKFSQDDGDQEDFLFARMTGLTLEDIQEMDVSDSKMLGDCFREMVAGGASPETAGRVPAAGVEAAAV